jgi:alpha-tubulin suppressor-like RCC1 family protein
MARNQVLYNVEDIFIGPCPASGYHFINYSGGLNNEYDNIAQNYVNFQPATPSPAIISKTISIDANQNIFPRNHNLLKRLDRIQSVSYEITSSRTVVNQIGKAASVARIHLNKPQINLTFNYLVSTLRNEARMGFNINYPRTDYPYTGDKYFYRTDNGDPLFLFSGFLNRDYVQNYPLIVNRGEGIPISSPCFLDYQVTTPNQSISSTYVPFYVGKNINPVVEQFSTNTGIIDIAAGFYHSFVLSASGELFGFGDNQEGQLTNTVSQNNINGEFFGFWKGTQVGKLTGVKKISTNYLHNIAILNDNKVTGWGYNEDGQAVGTTGYNDGNYLFTGAWSNSPISSLTGIVDISAGAYHSLALRSDRRITGWGDNISGQALSGNNLTGVTGISAGGYHSLAILNASGGIVTGWGDNDYLQASNGRRLTGVRMISAGHLHSVALLRNGRVTGWGWNDDGQVAGTLSGNNTSGVFTGNWNNTPVGNLTGVKSIHAGWFHTLALLEDNTITGWGLNNVGQLNQNIIYNNVNGIFTGNWNSTIVGSFQNIINVDTSYQTSMGFLTGSNNLVTGWGEDNTNYDLINQRLVDPSALNEYNCITDDPYWPLTTKDKRNIFIAINSGADDINEKFYEDFSNPDDQTFISTNAHPKAKSMNTIGIGNCYLSSYRQSASVGNFVVAEASYIGENMLFQMNGSGVNTPYINPKNYETPNCAQFNIPSELDSKNPIAALQPGDITVNINSSGYGLNLSDVRIQGYEFSFDFTRENMDAIGYKLPLDREVNLPLIINLSIDMIVGDQQYDNLADLVKEDADYNVSIFCKNTCNYDPNFVWSGQSQSSEFEKRFQNVFSYQFFNSKFEGITYSNQIGSRKVASFNFSIEIDPEDYTKGLQASGILGIEKVEDFILLESGALPALAGATVDDGAYLLQEDNDLLVSNLQVLY